jgi:hypothetical protein
MKKNSRLKRSLKILACSAVLMLPAIASADTWSDQLKRCLQDFGGIEWRLPYQPPMHIRSCASPAASYDTSDNAADGRRVLELIGELTLGPDTDRLSSDDAYAAIQEATFTHFDALFRRQGYRRTALEHGDARTRYDPNTLRMLHGLSPLPESADQGAKQEPPIPYVNLARYMRTIADRDVTLIYKADMRNTWRITLEGLPPASAASATSGAAR